MIVSSFGHYLPKTAHDHEPVLSCGGELAIRVGWVWLRWLAGADGEGLGAAERDVGVEGERLAGGEAQAGVAAGQLGDGDLRFQAAEVGAEAEVQALAEGQVAFGVGTVQVEPVWFGEGCFVAAR